jgi:hypothetical protein
MRPPQWLARFNRYFTNPIQRMWAGIAANEQFDDEPFIRQAVNAYYKHQGQHRLLGGGLSPSQTQGSGGPGLFLATLPFP